ncbi:MAG: 16S rRNA (guanine(527)-N(7))-methyltransferase RsmG [Clostridiales bacterium]|nr:16S rRNA (guanine(527)-N(7))-methyltransferase RsmG [Clostridiales bacterium]
MENLQPNSLKQSLGRKIFRNFLEANGFDRSVQDKFDTLTELYMRVNNVINISALRTFDDIYIKHYLDSIYPYKYFDGSCCDVGCGGGFPCLPLSIVTDLPFTGIDGVGKKLILIKNCKQELALNNIECEHIRAEELSKRGKKFDTVCSRALACTDKALAFCAPLAEKNGKIILYKTQNDEPASITVANRYNVKLIETVDYTLPETNINRRLFIYSKLL